MYQIYQVLPGETLDTIAMKAGISKEELTKINGLNNDSLVYQGSYVIIPAMSNEYKNYKVQKGDSIYSIAREAGSRTKMAVFSNDDTIDAVGACIGYKGARVNSIVDSLQGEKIDIINCLNVGEYIYPNQDLIIPNENNKMYVTKDNDTLKAISEQLKVPLSDIMDKNDNIYVVSDQIIKY